jgi:hypothetical protein
MAYDMFSAYSLTEVVNQIPVPKRGIIGTFFGRTKNFNTEHIELHLKQGTRDMAPFVSSTAPGVVVGKKGFEIRTFIPPRIRMKKSFDASDLTARVFGQPLHFQGGRTQGAMLQMRIGEELADLNSRIAYREEWMACKTLLDGKVDIIGDDVNTSIDFRFDASWQFPVLTGTAKWDDPASNPVEDIRDWVILIAQKSGLSAKTMLLGAGARKALMSNPNVLKLLDNRRVEIGYVRPANVPLGMDYVCTIEGVDLYAYNEWYIDPVSGNEMPMIPSDRVILGSKQANCVLNYGMIKDIEFGGFATSRFSKSWIQSDPSVRWILVETAPVPSPYQTAGFMSPTVI